MSWAVGHNMPGFMPEADVHVFTDWTDAKYCLECDLRYLIDYPAENGLDIVAEKAYEELQTASVEADFLAEIGRTVYWINKTDQEPNEGDWSSQYEE